MQAGYKCYPDIMRESIKQKCYRNGFRHWSAIVTSQNWPSDTRFSVQNFHYLLGLGVKICQLYNLLKAGNGKFWEYTKGVNKLQPGSIRMYSAEEVAAALGLPGVGIMISRELGELIKDKTNKTPYHALNQIYDRVNHPHTRAEITQFSGISRRSQQYYDKGNTHVLANYAIEGVYSTCEAAKEAFKEFEFGKYHISKQGVRFLDQLVPEKPFEEVYYQSEYETSKITDKHMKMYCIYRRLGNTRAGMTVYSSGKLKLVGTSGDAGIWASEALFKTLHRDNHDTEVCYQVTLEAPTQVEILSATNDPDPVSRTREPEKETAEQVAAELGLPCTPEFRARYLELVGPT
ncbi:MAG: hypothetical protein ACYC0V_01645 [Armatimonadota bacterium]